ncbi:GRIP and coiled-coil domain-containing protein 1 [Lamellibrachia satsuma]|nr:GRIP and coiled-coil domain-containing protein 1 [Lamellibrachia satsuma]
MNSRENRSELLKTVESQQEQLHRYEIRLRDVVTAYKGLLKEKEALGATVKALSVSQVATSKGASLPHRDPTDGGADSETDGGDTDSQQLAEIKTQLVTLTQSLTTLTSEKNKMEAIYQAEKKKLRHDYDEKLAKAEAENQKLQKLYKEQEKQTHELREKVRKQQNERDTEQNDHSLMLRELQKLLASERIVREQLEQQLDEAKQELREKRTNVEVSDHHERRIEELSGELRAAKKRCQTVEDSASQLSASVTKLQAGLERLKAEHCVELLQEQKRTLDAEEKQAQLSQHHEQVVSDLESKLSQLSAAVGDYEHVRWTDQANTKKLQERIAQLQVENSTLTQLTQSRGDATQGDDSGDEGITEVQRLIEKILKLKTKLKTAYEKTHTSVDVEELLHKADGGDMSDLHDKCHEEYEQLREEFERYKLRAQSVLKNIATKDSDGNKELDVVKAQVVKLKEKLHEAQSEFVGDKEAHLKKEEDLHRIMESLQECHRQEQLTQEANYKQKVADLEREIRRHRDRTIALLVEKDRELETLRAADRVRRDSEIQQGLNPSEAGASSGEESIVTELLGKSSLCSSTLSGEMSLLHFAQETARHDVQTANLRRQKHSLEMALRELQQSSVMKAENFSDEIEALKEQVRKLERSRSRESANLEYLKNVVYHYMISYSGTGRLQMANAIATILQFSPAERDAVQKRLHAGWWKSSAAVK